LERDLGDLLVAGVAKVEGAEVGAEAAGVAGEGDVPKRVGGVLSFLDDVDLCVGVELMEGASPAGYSVLRGVVVGVLGEDVGWGRGGVGCGVAELKLLVGGEAEACGGFGSGDVEVLDVDGLPGLGVGECVGGEDEFRVVNAVFCWRRKAAAVRVRGECWRVSIRGRLRSSRRTRVEVGGCR